MAIDIQILNKPSQDIAYCDAIVELLERANKANSIPYLYPQTREFFQKNLEGGAINIVAFDKEKVIGYTALRKMNPWPEYLTHLDYPPEHCALMLFNLVDADYRQQGIGKRLAKARLDIAKRMGLKHLFATIHPDNTPSLKSLTGLGFRILETKRMFSNQLLRHLLYLDLTTQAVSVSKQTRADNVSEI